MLDGGNEHRKLITFFFQFCWHNCQCSRQISILFFSHTRHHSRGARESSVQWHRQFFELFHWVRCVANGFGHISHVDTEWYGCTNLLNDFTRVYTKFYLPCICRTQCETRTRDGDWREFKVRCAQVRRERERERVLGACVCQANVQSHLLAFIAIPLGQYLFNRFIDDWRQVDCPMFGAKWPCTRWPESGENASVSTALQQMCTNFIDLQSKNTDVESIESARH